ncbi:MAG: response regulator [Polyangiales bacterium]
MIVDVRIVGRDETFAREICACADESLRVRWRSKVTELIEEMRESRVHIIVLDRDPEDTSALEALRQIRQFDAKNDAVILMVSKRAEHIDRIVAFEVGADDFVPYPTSFRELSLRLRALCRRVHDVSEATDAFTGRTTFDQSAK